MQNQAGHKNIAINLIKELVEQYDVEGDGKLNIKGNVGRGGVFLLKRLYICKNNACNSNPICIWTILYWNIL